MKKKLILGCLLSGSLITAGCGDGSGGSDQYINPYATVVNGEVVQQSVSTAGFKVDGKDLSYIAAFSMENGKVVYSVSNINNDGTFKINLKKNLDYSFVIFDPAGSPVLYVSDGASNVFFIRGETYVKIIVNLDQTGNVVVEKIEHDQNSELKWDDLFKDGDDDKIPDFAENDNDGDGKPDYDEDGDGTFDGVVDKDNDSVVEGSDDTDDDHLPDPIDDDDDNDGIPDDQDPDDDNDGIPDDQDSDSDDDDDDSN